MTDGEANSCTFATILCELSKNGKEKQKEKETNEEIQRTWKKIEASMKETKREVKKKQASHKSKPSSVPQGYVDSYSTLPWVTWESVTGVERLP